MNNKEKNLIKKEIIKALIEEKKGVFFKECYTGNYVQVYNGTDLEMVMDCVLRGLNSAQKNLKNNIS